MKKIQGNYVYKEEYKVTYINGAIGGFNAQGEIFVNFYLEKNNLPDAFVVSIDEQNNTGSEQNEDPKVSIIREIEHGYVMNIQSAENIIKWLQSNIENAKKAASQLK